MSKKAVIVYCSPAGTTRHVAQVIEKKLEALGIPAQLFDLGKKGDEAGALSEIQDGTCLFIGSPVYVSHAVPPVMNFISKVPAIAEVSAVPFVTWGGACSGIALYEMGGALKEKGINLIAAAKVLAVHSMMWQSEPPLGAGHPDAQDDEMIREMVGRVREKLAGDSRTAIPLSDLAYYPENIRAEMEKVTLEMAKAHMPKREVDENLCNECGICMEACPADAISLSPYPQFGDSCIYCFNCVKTCPEDAIQADISKLEERIRGRSKQFSEQPFTKIFI